MECLTCLDIGCPDCRDEIKQIKLKPTTKGEKNGKEPNSKGLEAKERRDEGVRKN